MTDQAKRAAARAAVEEHVRDGMVVGVGSGTTVVHVVEYLKLKKQQNNWAIRCVPSSFQARQLILEAGLTLSDFGQDPVLDVAIDGADEADKDLNLIKGCGGALLQEKIVASNAKTFVVVADYTKQSAVLGEKWKKGIPLEVLPMAYVPVMRKLGQLGGKPTLRMAERKAGPVVTDNGNFLVDVDFGMVQDPHTLNQQLLNIPGVLETGLFIHMAHKAYFGQQDGSVTVVQPQKH